MDGNIERLRPELEEFAKFIAKAIEDSQDILNVIEKIRNKGFEVNLKFNVLFKLHPIAETGLNPKPLVSGDDVSPDAFSKDDMKFLKKLRIELDEEDKK